MFALQPNLSFTQRALATLLQKVATKNKQNWEFSFEDIDDFSTQVAKRLRTMCRHVQQARSKDVAWAVFFTEGSTDDMPDALEDAVEVGDSEPEFYAGFNREYMHAWRCPAEDRGG